MHLLALLPFLSITIDINPTMADIGPFTLTWHGLFTAVGIIAGVTLSVWLLSKDGVPSEIGQEIALVGVPCAIAGARLFYVFEHWERFSDDLPKIVTGIQEGGITLYGGLLGGVIGGTLYALYRRWPIAIGLDAAAPGLILGQAIGRIGDFVNGEHLANRTDLPWGFNYVNPDSPQYRYFHEPAQSGYTGPVPAPFDSYAVHPVAGGYELLGDLVILGVLLLACRRWLKAPGWVFASYMVMYGAMRFALSYLRFDEQELWGIPVPQLVSGMVIGGGVLLAGILMRYPGPIPREWADRVWGRPQESSNGAAAGA